MPKNHIQIASRVATPVRALPGWVTVCRRVNNFDVTGHLGQLSLPSLLGKSSTSLSGWG